MKLNIIKFETKPKNSEVKNTDFFLQIWQWQELIIILSEKN